MPKKPAQKSIVDSVPSEHGTRDSKPQRAAELLSFLKQTRGIRTWTEKDLAKALKIGLSEAKEAIAALQLQGYIEAPVRPASGGSRSKGIWSPAPSRRGLLGKVSSRRWVSYEIAFEE
jgi:DNA-binding transcriptional MocR family regulator